MNKRLNEYLEKKGAKALDEGVLREYSTAMKERTIPEIEREIKKNEERAAAVAVFAELRFEASKTRSGKGKIRRWAGVYRKEAGRRG